MYSKAMCSYNLYDRIKMMILSFGLDYYMFSGKSYKTVATVKDGILSLSLISHETGLICKKVMDIDFMNQETLISPILITAKGSPEQEIGIHNIIELLEELLDGYGNKVLSVLSSKHESKANRVDG